MTGWTIATSDLFDGRQWRGPATITVEGRRVVRVVHGEPEHADGPVCAMLLPGLVDWGVSANGYQESPGGNPFAPETAFAALCLRYGVTTVVDINNTSAALAHLQGLAAAGRAPQVVHAGGRLATSPTSRLDVQVSHENLAQLVPAQQLAGAALVSIGRVDDPALTRRIVEVAGQAQMPVVVTRQYPRDTPGQLMLVGPHPSVPAVPGFAADPATGRGGGTDGSWLYAPALEAAARWPVEGLVAAPDAAMAAPFLPYARHFARGRSGFIGKRIARDVLRRYYGDRDPADLGTDRLELAAQRSQVGACVAASGAGGAGLVPGRSLWAELDRLRVVTGGTAAALFAATGSAESCPPLAECGSVAPGRPADLLLLQGVDRDSSMAELMAGLDRVVLRGEMRDVAELAAETDELIGRALEETA